MLSFSILFHLQIEIAKKLVQDLLNSRNDEGGVIGGGGGMGGMMGGGGGMMGGGGQGGLAKVIWCCLLFSFFEAEKRMIHKDLVKYLSRTIMLSHYPMLLRFSYRRESVGKRETQRTVVIIKSVVIMRCQGEVVVPRSSVGMIIGKGGDTIKRLAMETGTKIQFKPDGEEGIKLDIQMEIAIAMKNIYLCVEVQ